MVTKRLMRKMFLYVNQELFDNLLPEPEFYVMQGDEKITCAITGEQFLSEKLDGLCYPAGEHYFLAIDKTLNQYNSFCTMVHEMIHIWQMENKKPAGHSGWFRVWCEKAIDRFPFTIIN